MPDEQAPRQSWGLYKRYALAGAIIVLLTAASVSTAALLQVKDVVDTIHKYGHVATFTPDTITRADAGDPQTLLLVGSDKRFGATKGDARSDTLMLLRLDPDQQAIGVLSIPRDLLVDIPGFGREKINAAYSFGGLDLTTRTVKQLLGVDINHAIEINFSGFRSAVNFVGCVYTDVDRRYYHSNVGLPVSARYAEIDIQPGYQQLCGGKALDYVRFRHADTDIVRAARQQDFLRQAKGQVGTSRLLSDLKPLVKIFAKATRTDRDLQSNSGILRLLKLAAFSAGHPTREVHFPASFVNGPSPVYRNGYLVSGGGGLGSYVTATTYEIDRAVRQFLHAHAKKKKKKRKGGSSGGTSSTSSKKHKKASRVTSWSRYGLVEARRTGEDVVIPALADHDVGFPLYYPAALTPSGVYPKAEKGSPMPRIYTIRDRAGHKHQAYRLVVQFNQLEGQYYGVQGTTWRKPPLLDHGAEKLRMGGRTYQLYYDGGHLRAVAWRTPRGVYWVSNTLSLKLTNKQMLGTARSLVRIGS